MKDLIARKRIGRNAAGSPFRARASEARALVALGMADYAPKPKPKEVPKETKPATLTLPAKGRYARRDMVAETPAPAWPQTNHRED